MQDARETAILPHFLNDPAPAQGLAAGEAGAGGQVEGALLQGLAPHQIRERQARPLLVTAQAWMRPRASLLALLTSSVTSSRVTPVSGWIRLWLWEPRITPTVRPGSVFMESGAGW